MYFEVVGAIKNVETMATGRRIREIARLRKYYGSHRWRKLKGDATVRFKDDTIRSAEVHWYEAHGVGRKEMKIKRFLDEA